jgi:large subunit ribosomal protein L30
MSKVKVTLVKSQSGRTTRQRRTLESLGLGKVNSSAEHTVTPQIEGMIRKVNHLVTVENA